jgi:hypothetical protein
VLEVRHFSSAVFEAYRHRGDQLLETCLEPADRLFRELGVTATANAWYLQSAWKRALGVLVYGDLLKDSEASRVLEIGGGLSGITLALANAHDYHLVDLATHEDETDYRRVEEHLARPFAVIGDWDSLSTPEIQDVIIATDLFPNVDQRLDGFLTKYLPCAREMRLTLTYYEHTAWQVRRVSSGETLTIKPWGLADVTRVLDELADEFGSYDRGELVYVDYEGTLFANRRNILFVRLGRRV